LLPQFALVPMVLMVAGQLARLRLWMIAFGLALIATSAISVFTPAVAAFVYLDLTPQVYANIASTVYTHVPTLEALRAGTLQFQASIPLAHLCSSGRSGRCLTCAAPQPRSISHSF
jgi:hypothetical protein